LNSVELSIFSNRINAVCDEMGAVLQRAAFSPNIRDRLDYSCAIFDAQGEICAQAAHIPVHLGSMAYAMRDIVKQIEWHSGDMVVVNDPFLGGTHLPDVTVIAPVFIRQQLTGFVANRAHHADIGGNTPGSMPISTTLDEEGIIIPPQKLLNGGELDHSFMQQLMSKMRDQKTARGDFAAQISANKTGVKRLTNLISTMDLSTYLQGLCALNEYGERLAMSVIDQIPDGVYEFEDVMDDDGLGNESIAIKVKLTVNAHIVHADFSGTDMQTPGNINCPLSVVAAAVFYVFRCLMPNQTPSCYGVFRHISISAPEGCLLNARRPAAVAAGNVETSTRIVDVVMGALAKAIPEQIPAASHGSMNNLAMGGSMRDQHWDYYETIAGGMGAGASYDGQSAVQTHMTNTRNTPIEVMELVYPVRIKRYSIRKGSGGEGKHTGGDGVLREFEFLSPTSVTLLTERRLHRPWGLGTGQAAKSGENRLNGKTLAPKLTLDVKVGDILTIESAGGGGWG